MKNGCPFCDYDGPSEVLVRRGDVFFIEPLHPVVEGHVMAVPIRHVPDALADPELTGEVMEAAAWFAAGSCNLIANVGEAATQSVHHLHVHIVPRKVGDGLRLPWSISAGAAALTADELGLLRSALDSHEYWQLSDEHYRDSGFVHGLGSDSKEARDEIAACRALLRKLEGAS